MAEEQIKKIECPVCGDLLSKQPRGFVPQPVPDACSRCGYDVYTILQFRMFGFLALFIFAFVGLMAILEWGLSTGLVVTVVGFVLLFMFMHSAEELERYRAKKRWDSIRSSETEGQVNESS